MDRAALASGLHPVAAGGASIVAAKLPLAVLSILSIIILAIACSSPTPTDTPEPTPTPTPDPLATPDIAATLVASVAATLIAIPTTTPVPTANLTPEPTSPILAGWITGWESYGPDCPDNDPDCVISPDAEFISLPSYLYLQYYRLSNLPGIYSASLNIHCEYFSFSGRDLIAEREPIIGTDETLVSVWLAGSENQDKQYLTPYDVNSNLLIFLDNDYRDIISLIRLAEARKQTLVISAIAGVDHEPVIGLFDVTGFTVYYNRLDC